MTEQQAYEVVRSYEGFELRRYAPHLVAEVVVRGPFEDAGSAAFRTLFGYLNGQNESAAKVAMTAPVIQREAALPLLEPIEPVEQRATGTGGYAVAFVLPSTFTAASAPGPTNPDVHLRSRPEVLAAARRYRGRWTEASFEQHCTQLHDALRAAGLTPVGPPAWARFDPPFTPWFLRRNEVVQPVDELRPEADPRGDGTSP